MRLLPPQTFSHWSTQTRMSDPRFINEEFRWTTPGLNDSERQALAAQNQASLERKITFCLSRPDERVQFQQVEGWTTGRIIGYMHGRGLPLDRILADLAELAREGEQARSDGDTPSTDGSEPFAVGYLGAATYTFSRLCFKADVIEPLSDDDRFRVETPDGAFEMTKAQFRRDFANVVASRSYREHGLYHYPVTPEKALRYRVR